MSRSRTQPTGHRGRRRGLLAAGLAAALSAALSACAHQGPVLDRPNGVAVAADGSLLVVDKNHYRVVRLDPSGRVLAAFGGLGERPENLPAPYDIALGPGGEVHVCDRGYSDGGGYKDHDGVKVFSPDGRFLREIGGQDYGPTDLNNGPYGLDVATDGTVFVADYHRNRVRVFDRRGTLLRILGRPGRGEGELGGPNDVAVDERAGVVYVLDAILGRVQAFLPDGAPIRSFGGYGRGPESLSYPQYLDVDGDGNLYVSDMGNRRVQKYSPEGRLLASYTPGDAAGDSQLMGVTVRPAASGAGWEVLSVDTLNNRILVFDPGARLQAIVG